MTPRQPLSTLFPYTTLFRSHRSVQALAQTGAGSAGTRSNRYGTGHGGPGWAAFPAHRAAQKRGSAGLCFLYQLDRKSTRLNSSHVAISYAVFCLKKKKKSDE